MAVSVCGSSAWAVGSDGAVAAAVAARNVTSNTASESANSGSGLPWLRSDSAMTARPDPRFSQTMPPSASGTSSRIRSSTGFRDVGAARVLDHGGAPHVRPQSAQRGLQHLRDRPVAGGVVEEPFTARARDTAPDIRIGHEGQVDLRVELLREDAEREQPGQAGHQLATRLDEDLVHQQHCFVVAPGKRLRTGAAHPFDVGVDGVGVGVGVVERGFGDGLQLLPGLASAREQQVDLVGAHLPVTVTDPDVRADRQPLRPKVSRRSSSINSCSAASSIVATFTLPIHEVSK